MARVPTQKEIAAFVVGHGIVDFVTGGTLSRIERNALWKVIKKLGPPAARGAVGIVPSVARTVGMVAMRHPYVAAGAVIYVAVTEREKIRTLLEQGYDVIEERLPTPSLPPSPGIPSPSIPGVEEILLGGPAAMPFGKLRSRRPSAFNKAVSAGMKAVKKSTSYGGKGKIKPAKKAFSVVVKLASAKKKKKKAPKSGIRRRIWNAMKGLR
jgi:hypothetical protein